MIKFRTLQLLLCFIINFSSLFAQAYTKLDTMRGSMTPERAWWDLVYYDLDLDINPSDSSISGTNTIHYKVLTKGKVLQVDLQPPLKIEKVVQEGKTLKYKKNGSAYLVQLNIKQKIGANNHLTVYYSGRPHVAKRAPWDGGFSWSKDSNGKPFVATSCQGIGASIWWPCKDHMSDEPDSMTMSFTVPNDLIAVGNGRLRETKQLNGGKKSYQWFVSNPINNYGVNVNIGDYVNYSEIYQGLKGPLDLTYYVLRDNLFKAKSHFVQTREMMVAFEHWFGPYPFYEDGFKLVEVPYLGMEHQSSITYGNKYQNGYLGRDLSDTGWGLKFDFIIIHESGHEWFANNITYKDRADMWIHEGFTAYSESLFLEYYHGKEAGAEYVIGTRSNINNDRNIVAPYGVNAVGSGDMYYKGSNMLHTLRQVINNDDKWRKLLIELNAKFYHQTVSTKQIEDFISNYSELNLQPFFDQYLRDVRIPILEYRVKDDKFSFRWGNVVPEFNMPVRIYVNGEPRIISPVASYWKSNYINGPGVEIKLDPNYYVATLNIMGK